MADLTAFTVQGAGSPQGLLPGAPTDPGVHVKCTRFVTLWHIAVPHTTWSFRGDTLVRHGVLGVVPTPRPQRGTPLAPRGPEGSFPRFEATMLQGTARIFHVPVKPVRSFAMFLRPRCDLARWWVQV